MGFRSDTSLVNALLIFSIIFLGLSSATARDTITLSQFIRDSETVNSSDSVFKLGFFSPTNSTNRYLGIWYLSDSNVIWIANRDQPLKDSSGVLKISENGNLVVLDGKKHVIWSSNVSNTANTSTAQLLRSGNLVLLDGTSGQTIWESFKHPCDAAVPTMRISANRVTGQKIRFISRKSDSDPSTGYFSASLERLDAPEVFFWINGTRPYWRTGPWNGRIFIGTPLMSTGYLYGWNVGYEGNETVYLTYSFADQSAFGILTLNPQGKLKLVRYYNRKQVLDVVLENSVCDVYGTCGAYGSCDVQSSPICTCLRGYEPRNPEEWNRQNWTSGCVRKEPLKCERLKNGSETRQEDQFLKLQMMKVPDFAERLDVEEGQCEPMCLKNCSCLAYAYDAGIGCLYWSGPLIDLQQFTSAGIDLYIRNATNHTNKRRNKGLIIGITVAAGTIILATCAYLAICTYHSRKGAAKHSEIQSQRVTGVEKQVKLDELPLFDLEVVAIATNNFHTANVLGKGGFGPVYKGLLPDGQEIAVKRLSRTSGQGEDEVNTKRVVGTYGYMSPEYAMEGLFSEKSDVYSFGVLLLEIVSGKRNTSFRNDEQSLSLVGFAWNLWNEDKIRSMIDPDLSTSGSENHILRCIHIAFLCVQEVAKSRPTMTTVVLMLNSEISHLPPPKQVAFVQKQYSSSFESSSRENQCNSNNNVTLTEIQGR
ncbi:putative serine/threonine-protein kinase [Sesbania bispinosa]|nr:putative serine/threonine-protein kinase [Sesbania bispinosa]